MKKLAFLFVAVAAISFASCGNKTEQAAACCDSACADSAVVEVVDTVAADSVVADSAVVEAPAAE